MIDDHNLNFYNEELISPSLITLVFLALIIFSTGALVYQIVTDNYLGYNPASNYLFFLLDIVFVLFFLYSRRLTISINSDGVYFKYLWMNNEVLYNEIIGVEVDQVSLMDFSSLGHRYGRGRRRGFLTTYGDTVKLNLRDDNPLFFSSENPDKVVEIIKHHIAKSHQI